MTRMWAVAVNTFREAVRDRVLYGVLGMALVALALALALGEMALDQADRVVLDIGLATTSLFAVLVAIFLGSSLLYKEIERKTLYVILPKPIARHEFLLGKYFGITLTVLVFVAITGGVQLMVVALQAGASASVALGLLAGLAALLAAGAYFARDRTAAVVPWAGLAFGAGLWLLSTTAVDVQPIVVAIALILGEVAVLTSVALLFSAFSTPFLTGLFTFGVWLVGRSAETMATLKSTAIPDSVKEMLRALVHVWPNFHLFVPGRHTLVHQLTPQAGPLTYLGTSMAYAGLYSALLLLFAIVIFRRRDFV